MGLSVEHPPRVVHGTKDPLPRRCRKRFRSAVFNRSDFLGPELIRRTNYQGDPWLIAELHCLQPESIVCLGASAVRSAFGKDLPILKSRGRWMASLLGPKMLITVHPSSILRAPDETAKERAFADFIADLSLVTKSIRRERT